MNAVTEVREDPWLRRNPPHSGGRPAYDPDEPLANDRRASPDARHFGHRKLQGIETAFGVLGHTGARGYVVANTRTYTYNRIQLGKLGLEDGGTGTVETGRLAACASLTRTLRLRRTAA